MATRFTEFKRMMWKSSYLAQALPNKSPDLLVAAMDRLAAAILCAIFWGLTAGVVSGLTALIAQSPAVQVAGTAALIGGSFGVGVGLSSSVSHALKTTGILKVTLIGALTVSLGLLLGYTIMVWPNY